jgi:hypothetical protein
MLSLSIYFYILLKFATGFLLGYSLHYTLKKGLFGNSKKQQYETWINKTSGICIFIRIFAIYVLISFVFYLIVEMLIPWLFSPIHAMGYDKKLPSDLSSKPTTVNVENNIDANVIVPAKALNNAGHALGDGAIMAAGITAAMKAASHSPNLGGKAGCSSCWFTYWCSWYCN